MRRQHRRERPIEHTLWVGLRRDRVTDEPRKFGVTIERSVAERVDAFGVRNGGRSKQPLYFGVRCEEFGNLHAEQP